jgi:molybdate transport system regulatory protein
MARLAGEAQIGGRLWIDKGREGFLGRGRVELLAAIGEHGSISAAARHLGISYKAAWDRVDAMNNLAESPLVVRETGGKGGGGTRLTEEGRRLIAVFHRLELEYERWLADLNERLSDADELLSLVRGLRMRTSASNQLRGTVAALHAGEVNTEVVVGLDDGLELVAVITHDSVESLGLVPGSEVYALIKSSFVILTGDEGLRSSARNRLCGRVARILRGPVESEITLEIGSGKTLAAVITTSSLESLGLDEGGRACALIKAPHVIQAVAG